MKKVDDFIAEYIRRWEGGHSLHSSDNGNYASGKAGVGPLIGSNFGVTPAALAAHRGVAATSITRAQMAALTIGEAVAIGRKAYYDAPRLNLLPWNRSTASLLDMAWGAGPGQAIKLWQRMVGVTDDGKAGPGTAAATVAYIATHGEEAVAWQWAFIRGRFYAQITQTNPRNVGFLNGWFNRTANFTPADPWWSAW